MLKKQRIIGVQSCEIIKIVTAVNIKLCRAQAAVGVGRPILDMID